MIVSTTKARKLLKNNKLETLGNGKPSYYVLSEKKPHKNLGGPYTKEEAKKRLGQVERFKNQDKEGTPRKRPLRERTNRYKRRRSKVNKVARR